MTSLPVVTVFDLDDTLYPEERFARSGLAQVGRVLEARYRRPDGEITGALLGELEAGRRDKIFDEVLPRLALSPALIPELIELYRGHTPEISLYPDATEALGHFGQLGALALITDGPWETQRRKVVALGLEEVFAQVVYTDLGGRERWKPSPWGYRRVMERFELSGEAFCYVGDNPEKDFITPRRLGWLTVQIERPDRYRRREALGPEYQAHHRIGSLRELARLWPSGGGGNPLGSRRRGRGPGP